MSHRVLVTGLGAITAAGPSAGTTWQQVKNGRSGVGKIALWDTTGWDCPNAGEVRDYEPRRLIADRKLIKLLSRQDVLGLNAAAQALEQSGLLAHRDTLADPTDFNDRTGVFAGSPGTKYCQQYDFLPLMASAGGDVKKFGERLGEQVHPMWLLRVLPNNVIAYTGIQYGFKGPNENITNHGVSGLQAIAEASRCMKSGAIDRAVVVGYESGVEPEGVTNYDSLGVISREEIRPFDAARDGTLLAEGAGAIILETEEAAKARGAKIYGEILGSATTSEAQGVLSIRPDGEGLARALRRALEASGLGPEGIGMVTAHANGTILSDASEAAALSQVFGKHRVPVTGFKWALGHTLAAAGVIECILTLLSLHENLVPGIPTLKKKSHDCESVNASSGPMKPLAPRALLIARAYASLNSCLVVSA